MLRRLDDKSMRRIGRAVSDIEHFAHRPQARKRKRPSIGGGGGVGSVMLGRVADVDYYHHIVAANPIFFAAATDPLDPLSPQGNAFDPATYHYYFNPAITHYIRVYPGQLPALGDPIEYYNVVGIPYYVGRIIYRLAAEPPAPGSTPATDPVGWSEWFVCEPSGALLASPTESDCDLPPETDFSDLL